MNALLLGAVAFITTAGGGLLALRFRDRMHLVLSFTAGVLLGVVAFDILPEIFELAEEHHLDSSHAMITLVVGFMIFHAMEKFALVHHVHEGDYSNHYHPHVGVFSALALIGHSFMDGIGIGVAFQVSNGVGFTVALAVIAHDFCDGLNTVSLMLLHKNPTRRAMFMLFLDAVAPLLGAASTLAFHIPPDMLLLYLGFFAGFLLYVGVSDILPEAHSKAHAGAALRLISLTSLGAAFMYVAVRVAEG